MPGPVVEFIRALLSSYMFSHEQYTIDIYIQRTTKLLTSIIKSFVTLKVLIQNERTRWFTTQTLRSASGQNIEVGYSPSLLLLWTLDVGVHVSRHLKQELIWVTDKWLWVISII